MARRRLTVAFACEENCAPSGAPAVRSPNRGSTDGLVSSLRSGSRGARLLRSVTSRRLLAPRTVGSLPQKSRRHSLSPVRRRGRGGGAVGRERRKDYGRNSQSNRVTSSDNTSHVTIGKANVKLPRRTTTSPGSLPR